MKASAAVVVAALALILVGCSGNGHQAAASGTTATGPQIRQLHSIGELRRAFNAHGGVPRLIVLVSPT
jgi:hypothetical protein